MTTFVFKFPRVDAESIKVDAVDFGEAANKAIEMRKKHIDPLVANGDVYEPKPSLVTP